MKILIACWGDPSRWNECEYNFENEIVKSKTSASVLAKALKPDLIIINTPDTLVIDSETSSFTKYQDITNRIDALIKTKVEEFGLHNCATEINIVPGTGIYKASDKTYKFSHNLDSLSFVLYIRLLSRILQPIVSNNHANKKISVYTDLSQGVNYLTTVLYSSVIDVCHSLQLAGYDTSLEVYTCDPVMKGVTQSGIRKLTELSNFIHINTDLSDECFRFKQFVKIYSSDAKKDFCNSEPVNALDIKLKESETNAKIAFLVHKYGFPLAFYDCVKDEDPETYLRNIKEISSLVDNILSQYTFIKNEGNVFEIQTPYFTGWRELINLVKSLCTTFNTMQKKREVAGAEVSLRGLQSFAERHEATNRPAYYIMSTEIDSIKSAVIEHLKCTKDSTNTRTELSLDELLSQKYGDSEPKKNEDIVPRIFLAHGGFQREFVTVRYDGQILKEQPEERYKDHIFVRYTDPGSMTKKIISHFMDLK